MNRNLWVKLGTLGATLGLGGAVFLAGRRASAATPGTTNEPSSGAVPPIDLAPLPRAADVRGDLSKNWGDTPADLRPLLMLMEETSKIPGTARLYGVIAFRESQFITTAHNGNAAKEQDERDDSRIGRSYDFLGGAPPVCCPGPPVKPCVRISRTRLTDGLLGVACAG